MADAPIDMKFTATVDTRGFGEFLHALCGVFGPAPLDPDVARWEDDGGPPAPDPVSYTHTFRNHDPGAHGSWWTTYRLEGGERVPTAHDGPPAAEPFVASALVMEEYERSALNVYERVAGRFMFRRAYATEREQRRDEILQRAEAARQRYCQRQGHALDRMSSVGPVPYCLRCAVRRPDLSW
jgi:hypothetical protein